MKLSGTTQNVIRIFLASPGDLEEERRVTREVVRSLNRAVRNQGLSISLLGWEDTLPGMGRPQAIINRDVDECDLFIGLLWKRWGSNSGEYSSGFEEEFVRAKQRFEDTGDPEIWLMLKEVDPERKQDPGEQLTKVLKFQEELVEGKELLYSTFKDKADWQSKLTEYLLKYILLLLETISESDETPMTETPRPAAPSKVDPPGKTPVPEQVSELVKFESVDDLSDYDVARLEVLLLARSVSTYSDELIPNHTANLLYKNGQQGPAALELTPNEHFLWFRSLLNDTSDTVPGWANLLEVKGEPLDSFLFARSFLLLPYESRFSTGRDLMRMLRDTPEPFRTSKFVDSVIGEGFNKDAAELTLRKIEVLKLIGDKSHIKKLRNVDSAFPSDLRRAANEAETRILARESPSVILEKIEDIRSEELTPELIEELFSDSSQLGSKRLNETVRKTRLPPSLRERAAAILLERNDLSQETAKELVMSDTPYLRSVGYRGLVSLDIPIEYADLNSSMGTANYHLSNLLSSSDISKSLSSDANLRNVLPELLANLSEDELLGKVKYDLGLPQQAYRALAFRPKLSEQALAFVREGLQTGFKNVERGVSEALMKALEDDESFRLADLLLDGFTVYSLEILGVHGDERDLEVARSRLQESDYVKLEAIKIIAKHGDDSDVEALLAVFRGAYGNLIQVAGEAALSLAANPSEILKILFLDSKVSFDVGRSLIAIAKGRLDEPDFISTLKDLLDHVHNSVRKNAVAGLVEILGRDDLNALLNDYMDQDTYFYPVVCWLDRILYAPEPFQSVYRERLFSGNTFPNISLA